MFNFFQFFVKYVFIHRGNLPDSANRVKCIYSAPQNALLEEQAVPAIPDPGRRRLAGGA